MIDCDSEKFYEDDGICHDEAIQEIANILELCQGYSASELNRAVKELPSQTNSSNTFSKFSSYFVNIDGNKTNFNGLCAELERIDINYFHRLE